MQTSMCIAVATTGVTLTASLGYWFAHYLLLRGLRARSSERHLSVQELHARADEVSKDRNEMAGRIARLIEEKVELEERVTDQRATHVALLAGEQVRFEKQMSDARAELAAERAAEQAKLAAERAAEQAKLAAERAAEQAELAAGRTAEQAKLAKEQAELAGEQVKLADERARLEALRPVSPSNDMFRRHAGFFDGAPKSGITTTATRLGSPATARTELAAIKTTQRVLPEVPLCIERSSTGSIVALHTLHYVEFAADGAVQTIDAIGEAKRIAYNGKIIAIWVWDMENPQDSRSRMSSKLGQIYASKQVKDVLHGIFVWFNKVDRLDPAMRDAKLAAELKHIKKLLEDARLQYPLVSYYGSALHDHGLSSAFGRLLQLLELAPKYRTNGHRIDGDSPALAGA